MKIKFGLFIVLGLFCVLGSASPADSAHLRERWEQSFRSGASPETELLVTFTSPGGKTSQVRGFWDGGDVWRVRFLPNEIGRWTYRTRSRPADPGLDHQTGQFDCRRGSGSTPFLKHGAIRVSAEGHHFEHADGTPFLWLSDTAWNGALKSTPEDWNRYLDNRVSRGFTAVQFVVTQWRTGLTNSEGQVAFTGREKIRIHPEFFRTIDRRVDAVNAKGLLAVPVLLWTLGRKEESPGQLPEDQAIRMARYLVARYGGNHVAYFLAGDGNYSGKNAERWKRIGRAVFDAGDHAPVFLHPQGMQWPYDAFLQEEWLSAFGYQSGHGDDDRTLAWLHSGPPARKWNQKPFRPVINLEPPYEDHIAYQSRQRHTDSTVRRALYWSLLNTPTAGTSYGAHGVWSWETSPGVPRDHGGTGVARPWFEAMNLPGSGQVRFLNDLFTSIRWWDLRPDGDLVEQQKRVSRKPRRTHIIYTRNGKGQCALYLDGKLEGVRRVQGTTANWDAGFRLALANELTGDRPWRGELHGIALYTRALDPGEVSGRFQKGWSDRQAPGARVLYTFTEGRGNVVRDRSGAESPLDLKIDKTAAVRWIPGGGLDVMSPVIISASRPPVELVKEVKQSGSLTIEAWIQPANLEQAGPARIVTLSRDTGQRNFTLGQKGEAYEVRFRTTGTSPNGEPALSSGGAGGAARFRGAARSPAGDLAVVYIPTGGPVTIRTGNLQKDLKARWFNPRTGERNKAEPVKGSTFETPDGGDWVLVFTR